MSRGCRSLALILTTFVVASATIADSQTPAPDQELERRVQRVAGELRCLVCQNQTIADSNAPLAVDLRSEVREMLGRGSSDAEVREFMVNRYGDFILYRPPFKATTLVLWGGPFLLLIVGIWVLRRLVAERAIPDTKLSLSAEEKARADALLGREQGPERG